MNSIQTNSTDYILYNEKAIGGVAVIPIGKNKTKILVAWEWPDQAEKGIFGIAQTVLNGDERIDNAPLVNHTANYGDDVSRDPIAQKYFPNLFNNSNESSL